MAFASETFTVVDGLLSKQYIITDEAKAAELAIQKELISAIKDLTRAVRASNG